MRKKRTDQKGAPGICVKRKDDFRRKQNSGINAPKLKVLNSVEELETKSQFIIENFNF